MQSTLLNAVTADGAGTSFDVRGLDKASFYVSGTFKAVVKFEASFDDSEWFPFAGHVAAADVLTGQTSAPGYVLFPTLGVGYIRPKVAGYVSGSITVVGFKETLDIELTGSKTEDVTFQDAVVAAADGTVLTVGGYKTLTVYISGTSTSRTVEFKGQPPGAADGTYTTLPGIKVSDASLPVATSTTGTAEVWQFDITGWQKVIMDLSAVAGGNVTVKGTAVA